jgi:broad-specificity NMP kinase
MGVGKTATSKHLQKALSNCVFLDGDWCWDSSPFIVTEETKAMVIKNIAFLLNGFLACSAYENIIFCWVMHESTISESISSLLTANQYQLHRISLVCSPEALKERLLLDIGAGLRSDDVIERSLARLGNYKNMDTLKIDVSNMSAEQAAQNIAELVCPQ